MGEWAKPNDFSAVFRLTSSKYADAFIETPENWVNKELEIIVDIYEQVNISELSSSDRDIVLYEKELEAIKKEKPLAQLETSDRLRKDRVKCVHDYLKSLNY